MIFIDTGAWFASVVPWDANHAAARAWLLLNRDVLLTTDYVIDETLTLLRVRKENTRALVLGEQLFDQHLCKIQFIDETDVSNGMERFPHLCRQGMEFHRLHFQSDDRKTEFENRVFVRSAFPAVWHRANRTLRKA